MVHKDTRPIHVRRSEIDPHYEVRTVITKLINRWKDGSHESIQSIRRTTYRRNICQKSGQAYFNHGQKP